MDVFGLPRLRRQISKHSQGLVIPEGVGIRLTGGIAVGILPILPSISGEKQGSGPPIFQLCRSLLAQGELSACK